MSTSTRLRELLPHLRHPVVGAPLAFISAAPLATAVSRAGGLGFIAGGYDLPKLDAELTRARSLLAEDGGEEEEGRPKPLPIGVGLIAWAAGKSDAERERLLSSVLAHRPCALWIFAPDRPGAEGFRPWVDATRREAQRLSTSVAVFAQVSSVREAMEAADAGVDVIVAQGADAGGHGTKAGAGVISLVPEVKDALTQHGHGSVPLFAAGGVMDGRGFASVLALGADGAVLGTRLLLAEEATLHPSYRQAIIDASDGGQSTLRTRLFDELRGTTGWPDAYNGRALRNESVREWLERSASGEPNEETLEELKKAYQRALEERDYRRLVAWAGTGVGLAREVKPAAEIIKEIVEDSRAVVRRLHEKLSC